MNDDDATRPTAQWYTEVSSRRGLTPPDGAADNELIALLVAASCGDPSR